MNKKGVEKAIVVILILAITALTIVLIADF